VALSGTLDTFALPDVLRLLASTEKSGRLRVSGPRGSGSVWVDAGDVVATELTMVTALDPTDTEVIFGLLRFEQGSFTFEAGEVSVDATPGAAMEPILTAAESMLTEWRSIEEVVPSLDVWVALRPELSGPDVMVDAPRWRCIAIVGGGAQVGLVAETMHLNEVDSCRLVKDLIELGLLETIDAPAATVEPVIEVAPAPVVETVVETVDVDAEPTFSEVFETPLTATDPAVGSQTLADMVAEFEQHDVVSDSAADSAVPDTPSPFEAPVFTDEPFSEPSTVPSLASLEPSDAFQFVGDAADATPLDAAETDDVNPAEMARQLANLSPRAAKAVAAAAKATTEAEREAALAAVEVEDDSLDRGLLLKFLGSVDS